MQRNPVLTAGHREGCSFGCASIDWRCGMFGRKMNITSAPMAAFEGLRLALEVLLGARITFAQLDIRPGKKSTKMERDVELSGLFTDNSSALDPSKKNTIHSVRVTMSLVWKTKASVVTGDWTLMPTVVFVDGKTFYVAWEEDHLGKPTHVQIAEEGPGMYAMVVGYGYSQRGGKVPMTNDERRALIKLGRKDTLKP